ncbi:restriction endonuclease subunit S [Paenibacillus sp. FSL K6-1566]|uniref:restriction endonuclease subunit S n=1 Tax=Paenibacillus sp. FSL K6-1566 TaxID=2954515 RepID=UPI003100CF46
MSNYKKDWYGNTPLYWENKKLKYFLSVKNGKEITRELPNSESSIDVYGSGGVFKWTDKVLYSGESVLFGRKGTIGKPIFVNGEFWTVDTMYYTVFGNKAYPKYFFYLMKVFPWDVITTQTALPSIVGTEVENFECSVPVYSEQVEIATFLDIKCNEIKALIRAKEKMIFLLKEQLQTIITEAVTKGLNPDVKMKDSGEECIGEIPEHWEIKKIKHIAKFVGSGKTPKGGSEIYSEEGIPFLRSLNVHFNGLRLKDMVYISSEIDEEMKSTRVQPLDILLNITGASIGRSCIVPQDFGPANVNQHVCIIRTIPSIILPELLSNIMSASFIIQQILMNQNGSSREGLNFTQVKNLEFPLPKAIEEQKEITRYITKKVKEINDLVQDIKQQIEKLKEYRQSLIYEAVTGKIDVRDFEVVS